MPAPSFAACYQFEDAIESAVKTLLNNNSVTCYAQRDDDTLATPFASVQFVTGAATEHWSGLLSDGTERPDMFQGTLSIGIATDRDSNSATHATYRGKIRDLLYRFQTTITAALLPYHAILRVMETGTTPATATEDNHDISTINFNLWFQIRPEAWP